MTTLLVASGGGHLKQLHRLLPRLGVDGHRVWVTFDTGLSRSLLAEEEVAYAPYAHPHDLRGTVKDAAFTLSLLRRHKVDRAISTGANLAVATLPFLPLKRGRAEYIESATRSQGPSLSGRMLQKVPGIALYTQHPGWADKRWKYGGSVFENFSARHTDKPTIVRKIVVTLGSNDSFPFDRLVRRLQQVIPNDVEVLWQLGFTASTVPNARASVPHAELEAAMKEADAVIAHAGTGSAISALECGRVPVLVPRRAAHQEHVDDHQQLTCDYLSGLGLALVSEADELGWDDVVGSARWSASVVQDPPPFVF